MDIDFDFGDSNPVSTYLQDKLNYIQQAKEEIRKDIEKTSSLLNKLKKDNCDSHNVLQTLHSWKRIFNNKIVFGIHVKNTTNG